jgi:hypothetical protein
MRLSARLIPLVAVLLFASGCFWAGSWDGEGEVWERAFDAPVPEGVTVVHGHYWRSPHFTVEDGWSFQLRVTPKYRKSLFEHYRLNTPSESEMWKVRSIRDHTPEWFLPKQNESYEIWILRDEPDANFALFEDRESGDIFMTDSA